MLKRIIFICLIGTLLASVFVWAGMGYQNTGIAKISIAVDTADTNATGRCTTATTVGLTTALEHFTAVTGKAIVKPSPTTLRGLGNVDSAYLYVRTSLLGEDYDIASDSCASLPCTLYWASTDGDTLFKGDMYIDVVITDSSSDSVFTAWYDIVYDAVFR